MAEIILGIATSHTPMLTLSSDDWLHRAAADIANTQLNLSDGTWLDYATLSQKVRDRYAPLATSAALEEHAQVCEQALDRLAQRIEAAEVDLLIVIGDDQGELFDLTNMPALAVYYGETIRTDPRYGKADLPAWIRTMGVGYAMDQVHDFPGAPAFARELIERMVDLGIDVSAVADVTDPEKAGFGHAIGFVIQRLLRRKTPIVPVLLNTYFPPNVPSAARCQDVGRILRRAITESSSGARVAIVASGGLSHFIVDEELDRRVLKGLSAQHGALLRNLPRGALNSGSSEILNWVLTAGAVEHLELDWTVYRAVYRTPAGTGVGVGFAVWS